MKISLNLNYYFMNYFMNYINIIWIETIKNLNLRGLKGMLYRRPNLNDVDNTYLIQN